MVKFIKGFFFTVAVLLGYMIVFSTVNKSLVEKQVQELGEKAIENNDFSHFIPTRYYDETPKYNFVLEGQGVSFEVYVYNVGLISQKEDNLYDVKEGLSFIFVLKNGEIENFSKVKLQLSSLKEIDFRLVRIAKLPIYFLANDESQVQYLKLEDMQDETSYYPLTEISINNNGNTISYVFTPLDINEFQLKEPLLNHLNTYNEPPSESFGFVKVSPVFKINTFGPVLLWTAIYMFGVAIIVFIYFLIKNRKNLGRKKPTEGLQKDIDRVKHSNY